ncbi:hypothetical protein PGTUg99_000305 [Puccinia graminis f. sp. tritici]|uniref:Translation initiation factor IF- 2 domain-containing protein n=1 Tax=Puccinia graminis f. sp. tritici TaxID=56615 RepID=A0A5B0P7D4_PUCGR|nr:hypothetical protein PGTUg99_000305 [Puccinia graminis f. sp. tritici]
MAIASGAQLVGFNVKIDPMAFSPIESHKVKYTIESVIYRLVDSVTQDLVKLLPKRYKERVIGEAKILQIFEINSSSSSSSKIKSKVAGCKVSNGEIKKSCSIKILRNKEIIWKARKERDEPDSEGARVWDILQRVRPSRPIHTNNVSEPISNSNSNNGKNEEGSGGNVQGISGQTFDRFDVNDEILAIEDVLLERTLNDGL